MFAKRIVCFHNTSKTNKEITTIAHSICQKQVLLLWYNICHAVVHEPERTGLISEDVFIVMRKLIKNERLFIDE